MRGLSKSFHAASCCSRSGRPERHVQRLLLRILPALLYVIEVQSILKHKSYFSSCRHFHPCITRRTFFSPAFLLTACANAFSAITAGMTCPVAAILSRPSPGTMRLHAGKAEAARKGDCIGLDFTPPFTVPGSMAKLAGRKPAPGGTGAFPACASCQGREFPVSDLKKRCASSFRHKQARGAVLETAESGVPPDPSNLTQFALP